MSAWSRAWIVGLLLWSLAGSGRAGTLDVQFALGGGQITAAAGGLISNTETMFTGSARVVLTGVDSLGAITAPSATASLRDLAVQLTFTFGAGVAAPFQFALARPVTGSFDGATLGIAPMGLTLRGINGRGSSLDFTNRMALALQLSALDMSGAGRLVLNSILQADTVGFTAVQFNVVGSEVSRRFSAPEPPEIALAALGLALLAACAFRARRIGPS